VHKNSKTVDAAAIGSATSVLAGEHGDILPEDIFGDENKSDGDAPIPEESFCRILSHPEM
jgi:hypothetical protein